MFTMATRKRVILTLDTKVKVIRQHEKGIGSRQLAAEFGVGKTQINNIVTAKADIYVYITKNHVCQAQIFIRTYRLVLKWAWRKCESDEIQSITYQRI